MYFLKKSASRWERSASTTPALRLINRLIVVSIGCKVVAIAYTAWLVSHIHDQGGDEAVREQLPTTARWILSLAHHSQGIVEGVRQYEPWLRALQELRIHYIFGAVGATVVVLSMVVAVMLTAAKVRGSRFPRRYAKRLFVSSLNFAMDIVAVMYLVGLLTAAIRPEIGNSLIGLAVEATLITMALLFFKRRSVGMLVKSVLSMPAIASWAGVIVNIVKTS